jgi:Protein of unknown function (DUF3631)
MTFRKFQAGEFQMARENIFPEIEGLKKLKFFREDPETYGLYQFYEAHVTRIYEHEGMGVGCVQELLPVTDSQISTGLAHYRATVQSRTVRAWRKRLQALGRIICIPHLDGGYITLLPGIEIGPEAGFDPLPEMFRRFINPASAKTYSTIQETLLADIKTVISMRAGQDRISSRALVMALKELPECPWKKMKGCKELTPIILSKMLLDFNIRPRIMKLNGKTLRGYFISELQEVAAVTNGQDATEKNTAT